MVISAPFKINKKQDEAEIRGYGATERKDFFHQIISEAKDGKLYQIKLVEVTPSEVQRNYMFMCLKLAANELGYSQPELRAVLEDIVFKSALDAENDFWDRTEWIIEPVDKNTGEVKAKALKTLSTWKVGMMNQFIELIHFLTCDSFPKFKFPDPEKYKGEILGKRHEVSDSYTVVKLDN